MEERKCLKCEEYVLRIESLKEELEEHRLEKMEMNSTIERLENRIDELSPKSSNPSPKKENLVPSQHLSSSKEHVEKSGEEFTLKVKSLFGKPVEIRIHKNETIGDFLRKLVVEYKNRDMLRMVSGLICIRMPREGSKASPINLSNQSDDEKMCDLGIGEGDIVNMIQVMKEGREVFQGYY